MKIAKEISPLSAWTLLFERADNRLGKVAYYAIKNPNQVGLSYPYLFRCVGGLSNEFDEYSMKFEVQGDFIIDQVSRMGIKDVVGDRLIDFSKEFDQLLQEKLPNDIVGLLNG